MKKLGTRLRENGYVAGAAATDMVERGRDAARELPATEDLAQRLTDCLEVSAPQCDEVIDDHFTVTKAEPGKLHLLPMMGDKQVVVPVTRAISAACSEGWTIAGVVGQVGTGWRLLEVWNVEAR